MAIVLAGAMVAVAVYLALKPPDPRASAARATEAADGRSGSARSPGLESSWEAREGQPNGGPPTANERDPDANGSHALAAPGQRVNTAERPMAIAGPLAMPRVDAALAQRVERDARAAFEDLRARVRSECWGSSDGPDSVDLILSLSFDASGSVIASGVAESREASRPTLATCLRPMVHGLKVPAPGSPVAIEIGITLP